MRAAAAARWNEHDACETAPRAAIERIRYRHEIDEAREIAELLAPRLPKP
jgi:hypothetical protein